MPIYPETPDGRYFIVRGRLWRRSNPALGEVERARWVSALMTARRAIRAAGTDAAARSAARAKVHEAKLALGERGPVWWTDGTPDENRRLVRNSRYADWYESLSGG